MQIPLGQYSYKRADGLLPSVNLRNVFYERSPVSLKDGTALLTRPMLVAFADLGGGPVRGVFFEEDTFSDKALVAATGTLYALTEAGTTTSIGSISGSDRVEVAFGGDDALVASGGSLQTTDGVTLSAKAFPASQPVASVGFLNGYYLAVPVDSHRIYYTDPTTNLFDTARFISAERYPDNVQRIIIIQDEIWAFGTASVEVFVPTGVDDIGAPPFQRVEGRLYKKGTLNAASIVEIDNTVIWAGYSKDAGCEVYRAEGGVPIAVNDESIAERLSRADPDDLKAWAFGMNKHSFYVLAMGAEGTWALDVLTGGWFEWTSLNRDQWRAHVGRGCWPGVVVAGDDETGALYTLSDTAVTDNGVEVEQTYTAGVPVNDARTACSSLSLDCAVGQAALGVTPLISMSYSDDQGRTWQEEDAISLGISLGLTAEYDTRVRWNRLGLMVPPGRIFEWTTTDPVRMRVSSARINDDF